MLWKDQIIFKEFYAGKYGDMKNDLDILYKLTPTLPKKWRHEFFDLIHKSITLIHWNISRKRKYHDLLNLRPFHNVSVFQFEFIRSWKMWKVACFTICRSKGEPKKKKHEPTQPSPQRCSESIQSLSERGRTPSRQTPEISIICVTVYRSIMDLFQNSIFCEN